jgi:hypothetical protein
MHSPELEPSETLLEHQDLQGYFESAFRLDTSDGALPGLQLLEIVLWTYF